jgi:SagB-type dehydrogenase family enzyme
MPKNILFESGPDGSPGLFLHAWTNNVRGGMVHGAERTEPVDWRPGDGAARAFATLGPAQSLAVPPGSPRSPGRSTFDTLAHRRSIRTYADEPLGRDELARLLSMAFPARTDAPPLAAPHRGIRRWQEHRPALKLVPLALRVDGVAPGAYLYAEDEQTIRLTRDDGLLALVEKTFFQAEFTVAPAIILLVGSIADMVRCYGDRGYRYLLLDTGVMIQRLYLAASCLDVSGSITGSFVQSTFDRWLGLDGYNAGVLMAFATGRRPLEEDRHE